MSKEVKKVNVTAQRNKDMTEVRGIFRNFETPGGILRFSAKSYAGEKVRKYELYDNQICSIPAGIARRLARDCFFPVHQHAIDADGRPAINIGKKVYRFGFQSTEFMGDDFEKPLIETPLTLQLSL